MSYAQQTIKNKSWFKRFSHGKRFEVAVDLIKKQQPSSVLDYGTGNGFLLLKLADEIPDVQLSGYDPIEPMFRELSATVNEANSDRITVTNNLNELSGKTFEVVSCQEVLEHFDEKHQLEHIQHLKNHLSLHGKLVVSVPLETGLSSLFKNLVRVMAGQRHSNTSITTVFRSIFGLKVKRQGDPYIHSHVGFRHRPLERLLESEGLKIVKKQFSPLPIVGSLINSQIFYVLEKKEATS